MSDIFFFPLALTGMIMKDPKTFKSYMVPAEAVNKPWFWIAF